MAVQTVKIDVGTLNIVRPYLSRAEFSAMTQGLQADEAAHFTSCFHNLAQVIQTAPDLGGTEGLPEKQVILHYFSGGSDWWITELGQAEEKDLAFGYACLNGWYDCAELGYISISELTKAGVNLDLFWQAKPLNKIIAEVESKI